MKANVSKNARTDRKKAEKLKYEGQEIEPAVLYGNMADIGRTMKVAMYTATKKLVKSPEGDILSWNFIASKCK